MKTSIKLRVKPLIGIVSLIAACLTYRVAGEALVLYQEINETYNCISEPMVKYPGKRPVVEPGSKLCETNLHAAVLLH